MFIVTNANRWLQYKCFTFSGGEVSVKLQPAMTNFAGELGEDRDFFIKANIFDSNGIMELCNLVDALRQAYGDVTLHLKLPYLPYARQDRVCAPGESLALKVFANILNSLKFASVTVADVHSDVSLALIDNVVNVPVEDLIDRAVPNLKTTVTKPILVAPDAGSIKKVLKVAKKFNLEMIRADKIRDVNTGDIVETVVYADDLGERSVLVVDDICDGGRTFIELAKVLRSKTKGELGLYVTHGIFSKGLEPLLEHYDKIYCAYPFIGVQHRERLIRG